MAAAAAVAASSVARAPSTRRLPLDRSKVHRKSKSNSQVVEYLLLCSY